MRLSPHAIFTSNFWFGILLLHYSLLAMDRRFFFLFVALLLVSTFWLPNTHTHTLRHTDFSSIFFALFLCSVWVYLLYTTAFRRSALISMICVFGRLFSSLLRSAPHTFHSAGLRMRMCVFCVCSWRSCTQKFTSHTHSHTQRKDCIFIEWIFIMHTLVDHVRYLSKSWLACIAFFLPLWPAFHSSVSYTRLLALFAFLSPPTPAIQITE